MAMSMSVSMSYLRRAAQQLIALLSRTRTGGASRASADLPVSRAAAQPDRPRLPDVGCGPGRAAPR
eukprot:3733702-Prymnesium_polylepis.1